MGKLQLCTQGRRGFLRGCVVLGIGAALIGSDQAQPPAKATREASASGGFVVINGWVLPSQYFRDGQA